MFRFENESFLYLLFFIGFFVFLYILLYYIDQKRFGQYCEKQLLIKLSPQRSSTMQHIKFSLLMLTLVCFIFAAANPQSASKVEKGKRKGVDIMICLDVSNSMLATDIQPNRLGACKMAISHFIDKLEGDRIGLTVFAGKSFVQLPITTDYAAAKMFVNQVNTNLIPAQGTDISAALNTAERALIPENEQENANSKNAKPVTSKVILLVSDGEDHYPEGPETAAKLADKGIIIHTIGIGDQQGAPIPIQAGSTQYKKDANGNTVITRLNEQVLKDLASSGKGLYVHADNANMGFESILEEINNMEKTEFKDINFTQYDSFYQYPLGLGIILLLIESFMFAVKPKWKTWLLNQRAKLKISSFLILLLSLICFGCQNEPETSYQLSSIQLGNLSFKIAEKTRNQDVATIDTSKMESDTTGFSRYTKALVKYAEAIDKEPVNQNIAAFNQMAAFYRQHNFDTIDSIAGNLKNVVIDKALLAKIFFNEGNAFMQRKQYSNAVESYKNALRRNPNDMDAKYNLEYAKKMIRDGKDKSSQGGGQNQQNQQKGDQKQQQNQQQQGNQKQQGEQKQQGQKQQDKQGQNGQSPQGQKDGQQKAPQESAAQKEKKQAMERQLEALQLNERQTQQKVNAKKSANQTRNNSKQEKDW